MYRLARLLKDKGDLSRARTLFIEAASQGHKPSMYIVGKMLMRGQGGEIEARSGREWLVRAAEGGHAFAQRDLLWMQIESCGSMRDRIGLYYKLVVLGCSLIPRFARDPYSQDLY
jgi:TPR repeat protein